MSNCLNWPIGVCSWSANDNLETLAQLRSDLQLEHIHLHVAPAMTPDGRAFLDTIAEQGWKITATMIGFPQEDYTTIQTIEATGGIVPDDCWPENRKIFLDAIDVTVQLGVKYLTSHFGFIDPSNETLMARVIELADAAAEKGVTILMETGQETADELAEFLTTLNHPAIGVNFDPANMILYGKGDPVAAIKTLAPWIKHIHIKDATPTDTPGTWGTENPWSKGKVGDHDFLRALTEVGYEGALAIERECGDSRFQDVKLAIERLTAFKG